MSYSSERTAGTQTAYIYGGGNTYGGDNQLKIYFKALTGSGSGAGTRGIFDENNNIKLNGTTYKLKNYERTQHVYNLYDIVAVSKAAGYSDEQINTALNEVYKHADVAQNNSALKGGSIQAKNFLTDYNAILTAAAPMGSVAAYMSKNTVPSLGALVDEINKNNPDANAYIETKLNKDGVTYTYTLKYTNPANGNEYSTVINPDEVGIQPDGQIDEAMKNTWFDQQGNLGTILKQNSIEQSNAVNAEKLGEAVSMLMDSNLGTTANTHHDLSQADINALTPKTPGTENLTAWNKTNNSGLSDTVASNLKVNQTPNTMERASLTALENIARSGTAAQSDIATRGIDNQQQQLLQQIRRDPELYSSIVAALRSDAAAGTIAGQRAANIQSAVAEADANYDTTAADLYNKLFGGEQSAAATEYGNTFNALVGASDQYFTGALNNLIQSARGEQTKTKQLETVLNALTTALEVDNSRYFNSNAAEQAKADKEASTILDEIKSAVNTQTTTDDANLNKVADSLGLGQDYLSKNADVSSALGVVLDALNSEDLTIKPGSHTIVKAGDFKTEKEIDNDAYNKIVNDSDAFKYLDTKTIEDLISIKSLDKLKSEFNLDALSEAGLEALYEGYAKEANKKSNRIFNKAQRAYIAAITAGDAKTAEQLTRLASSAGASKGNLYAASALANQYKQQFNAGNTGRQLATDYLNQIATNQKNISDAQLASNGALTKYLGNGTDSYDAGTLYGAKNLYDQEATNRLGAYSKFNNSLMSATQSLQNVRDQAAIDNYNRWASTASDVTDLNLQAHLNNITNAGTKQTYKINADAMSK